MLVKIVWVVLLINFIAINAAVFDGIGEDDISIKFQEREAITFLSAMQLMLTAFFGISSFALGRTLYKNNPFRSSQVRIWLISSGLFLLGTLDEWFMIHEGIDNIVTKNLLHMPQPTHFDGITLSLYGVAAIVVFFKFRNEVLRHRNALALFAFGGVFFLLSCALNLNTTDQFQIICEESYKLMAVGCILLGHIAIFINMIHELKIRLYS